MRLFKRQRDGQIAVFLNDDAREIVREAIGHVVAAERDPTHEWHRNLNAPINPNLDSDDPLAMLARQNDIASNAELALLTLREERLNESEAWAWLSTLQIALRETALANGLLDEGKLATADPELLEYIRTLQIFLFALAECL